MGALPVKDAVVPPASLRGTGPVRVHSVGGGDKNKLLDTTTFMSSDKAQSAFCVFFFVFLPFLFRRYRRCTAGVSVRGCLRASASKAVQQSTS